MLASTTGTFRYLFRYRDLVAKTLSEHRKIIRNHGACWWGWWKRPSEPGHLDVWRDLYDKVGRGDGITQVGLFDSGPGNVYRATIDAVIVPEMDEFDQFRPIRPPAEE